MGYVQPACWLYPVVSDWGGSVQPPSLEADPPLSLDADPPWCRTPLPDAELPLDVTCDACWEATPPLTEWQTGVKTLPCPKLRLRAVTNSATMSTSDKHGSIFKRLGYNGYFYNEKSFMNLTIDCKLDPEYWNEEASLIPDETSCCWTLTNFVRIFDLIFAQFASWHSPSSTKTKT